MLLLRHSIEPPTPGRYCTTGQLACARATHQDTMSKPRPSMFIGSSAEGLAAAEAIQLNLDRACEVTVWHQGVFGLGLGTLELLVNRLTDFDFAALILTPDDVTVSRNETQQSPRDNVLLELGLFIGAIGRERTFIVFDRGAGMKLPSDLAGVTPATYERHSTGNLQSSLGAATTLIKGTIERLGKRTSKIGANVDGSVKFQMQQRRLVISSVFGGIDGFASGITEDC
jgi:predicted nucleotide-binding protein